jgi:general secretion pathway protein I
MSRRPETGFTLLEVLVALLVLGVAVVAALGLVGGALRLARASADHVEATLLAQAKLAEAGVPPLEETQVDGTQGPYRWSRRVVLDPKLLPGPPEDPDKETVRLARVSVEVEWGVNRRVELVTLRAWGVKP